MPLLLDTHAALWWLMEPKKLSPKVAKRMQEENEVLYISAVSMFEIAQKSRSGRLPFDTEMVEQLPTTFAEQGWLPLPLSIRHAERAGTYSQAHRDPFDRMLAAQAEVEGLSLISCDKELKNFPIKVFW